MGEVKLIARVALSQGLRTNFAKQFAKKSERDHVVLNRGIICAGL